MVIPLVKVLMPQKDALMPELERVMYSGQIAEGEIVYDFEKNFSQLFNLKHVVAMSSGTAALHASLVLAGVGKGDEVITTPMTAEPTNLSILYAGATPVWADVDPLNGNITSETIEKVITKKTKAILVVHYAGYPAEIEKIRSLAESHNLKLIEDCAHALGATYEDSPIGSFGDYAIFSFQAIKHMTTIDGGILVVKDSEKIEIAKRFRWFGLSKKISREENDIKNIGYKYNMTNVSAAIGNLQLSIISNALSIHKENGEFFNAAFKDSSAVKPAKICQTKSKPTYWLYTLLCNNSDLVSKKLESKDIQSSKLHKPNNFHTIFKTSDTHLPGLNEFYRSLLHIPCGWWVDKEIRQKIVDVIRDI